MDSLHMAPLVEVSLDFSDEAVFGTSVVRFWDGWDGAIATGQGGNIHNWLVVWNMSFLTFHSVGNVIIPTVTHSIIFRRGWQKNTN